MGRVSPKDLEERIEQTKSKIADLEAQLARDLADGVDETKTLDELTKARAVAPALARALAAVEAEAYARERAAYQKKTDAIEDGIEATRRDLAGQFEKFLSRVRSAVEEVPDGLFVDDTVESLTARFADDLAGLLSSVRRVRIDAIGPEPKRPPERAPDGHILDDGELLFRLRTGRLPA
jgi:predicted  nucleic acid-binding Zn-ribbon protein